MSACRHWNEEPAAEKTWTHFKSHFAAAQRQHKHIKGETAAHAVFHSPNAAMTQTGDHMAEATSGALENLATASASDRGALAALAQANSCLVKHLEETSSELREMKALLHQERRDKRGPRDVNTTANNYCWTHGYKVGKTHTSLTCNTRVKLPQPQLRARTYTQTDQSTLRATQVRAALSHAYAITYQNRITDKP
jgi:hypothetical protein